MGVGRWGMGDFGFCGSRSSGSPTVCEKCVLGLCPSEAPFQDSETRQDFGLKIFTIHYPLSTIHLFLSPKAVEGIGIKECADESADDGNG